MAAPACQLLHCHLSQVRHAEEERRALARAGADVSRLRLSHLTAAVEEEEEVVVVAVATAQDQVEAAGE